MRERKVQVGSKLKQKIRSTLQSDTTISLFRDKMQDRIIDIRVQGDPVKKDIRRIDRTISRALVIEQVDRIRGIDPIREKKLVRVDLLLQAIVAHREAGRAKALFRVEKAHHGQKRNNT